MSTSSAGEREQRDRGLDAQTGGGEHLAQCSVRSELSRHVKREFRLEVVLAGFSLIIGQGRASKCKTIERLTRHELWRSDLRRAPGLE